MFSNHYMKKYQDFSLIAFAKITKKGITTGKIKLPYCIHRRTHLITGELLYEEMRGYRKSYTKVKPVVVNMDNDKKDFAQGFREG